MNKKMTDNGMVEHTPDYKSAIKIVAIWAGIFIALGAGIAVAMPQPKQVVYESKAIEFQKAKVAVIQAREDFLIAEKELAVEKIKEETKKENWEEISRLTDKIKQIDEILSNKAFWGVF
jgi:hypothetical protein